MRATSAAELRGAVAVEATELVDLSWTPWRRIWLSAREPVWTLVDAVDFDWLSQNVWNEWHAGNDRHDDWMRYAKRNVGRSRATLRMHREILIKADPRDDEFLRTHSGDHINGQTLDNRRANLRWSTKKANARNRRPRGSAPSLEAIVLGRRAAPVFADHDESSGRALLDLVKRSAGGSSR
jgi:hypothetical protein